MFLILLLSTFPHKSTEDYLANPEEAILPAPALKDFILTL